MKKERKLTGGMLPRYNFKIALSKMQFPAFSGKEMINWKGFFKAL